MARMDNLLQWSVLPDTFFAVGIEAFLGIEAVGIEVGIETEGIHRSSHPQPHYLSAPKPPVQTYPASAPFSFSPAEFRARESRDIASGRIGAAKTEGAGRAAVRCRVSYSTLGVRFIVHPDEETFNGHFM